MCVTVHAIYGIPECNCFHSDHQHMKLDISITICSVQISTRYPFHSHEPQAAGGDLSFDCISATYHRLHQLQPGSCFTKNRFKKLHSLHSDRERLTRRLVATVTLTYLWHFHTHNKHLINPSFMILIHYLSIVLP